MPWFGIPQFTDRSFLVNPDLKKWYMDIFEGRVKAKAFSGQCDVDETSHSETNSPVPLAALGSFDDNPDIPADLESDDASHVSNDSTNNDSQLSYLIAINDSRTGSNELNDAEPLVKETTSTDVLTQATEEVSQ